MGDTYEKKPGGIPLGDLHHYGRTDMAVTICYLRHAPLWRLVKETLRVRWWRDSTWARMAARPGWERMASGCQAHPRPTAPTPEVPHGE